MDKNKKTKYHVPYHKKSVRNRIRRLNQGRIAANNSNEENIPDSSFDIPISFPQNLESNEIFNDTSPVDIQTEQDLCIDKSVCIEEECTENNSSVSEHNSELSIHEINYETTDPTTFPSGRRIVDINYFLNCVLNSKNHSPFDCGISDMDLISEKRTGLLSIFTLKCRMCNIVKKIESENPSATNLNINTAAVLAMVSTGGGHSEMIEQHAIMDIPSMSYRKYTNHYDIVSDKIHETTWKAMEEAGKEEADLARAIGDVDKDGYPLVTIIADGAWSKRSYKVNYDAASGVACIVGAKTGKLLFMAVRNKYCPLCEKYITKHIPTPQHKCFKNWCSTSTSMESDIILEGFMCSVQLHGIKYNRLIGDGDSSVYSKICAAKPYGNDFIVQKIQCTNHLLRNYCTRLRSLGTKSTSTKNKYVNTKLRSILSNRILRLRIGISKAVGHWRQQNIDITTQISKLTNDILNCPYHVFGEHKNCEQYFCTGSKDDEENYVDAMKESGLLDDIISCGNRLIQNAYSLLLNMNNNAAESYNSVVCKFVGGKRINFAIKNGYDIRCRAAALSFNKKEEYYSILHKAMTNKSPGKHSKKYINSLKKRRMNSKAKKKLFKSKKKTIVPPDEDYGLAEMANDDLNEEEFISKKDIFLNTNYKKSSDDLEKIEKSTIGQASNPEWKQQRLFRLTASTFGPICKLRSTTSCCGIIKKILYEDFRGNAATRWGLDHEANAIRDFETKYDLKVSHCGLFIHLEYQYLGASPDGIINSDNSIVEVKCPFSASKFEPEDAITKNKIKYMEFKNNCYRLKSNNNYYYQVQGQLQITKKQFCYFILWTPLGMIIEKIERNDKFWNEKMLPKLKLFYNNCMLPEIIDPRHTRGMKIRNPPH